MPSVRETALSALMAALTGVAGAAVRRNAAVPERIPGGGLVIVRDGEPRLAGTTLSPLRYHWEHEAVVEVLVQVADDPARALALDGLLRAVDERLAADRSLGATVEWLDWPGLQTQDLAVPGAPGVAGAVVTVTLVYSTATPLG